MAGIRRQICLVEMDGAVIGRRRHQYERQQFRHAPRRLYRHRRERAHTDPGDNKGGPNLTSRVTFAATAGVTYRIAIDGTDGASGNFRSRSCSPSRRLRAEATIASWNFDTPRIRIPSRRRPGTDASIPAAGAGR